MLEAVIFDMDGVIIDSEPMHSKAAILALKKYNVEITDEDLQEYIGSTTTHMCRKMVDDYQLSITPEELVAANDEIRKQILKLEGYIPVPYIIDLIKDLHSHGIPMIIASSSPSQDIEDVMEQLKIKEYFIGYVSGSMVKNPKPDPEIFLLAANRLQTSPKNCLVIEDSYNGVTAATAAGMVSIGFINPNSGNQDLNKAAILVEGFDEVDYKFINKVYQRAYLEPVTILSTEHFILRELSLDDMEDLFLICSKEEIREYITDFEDNFELEKEKLKAYIKNVFHFYDFGLWGVFKKDDNKLIGRCGIELKMVDGEEVYELGYLLDPAYQGQGYAQEFVSAAIDYCFHKLALNRIVAIIHKQNLKSMCLIEKIGMRQFGTCIRNQKECIKYEMIR